MATGVGLRIAEDECTAAIVTDAGQLDFLVRDSILHMAEDGDTVLGGDAPPGSHSITGFVGAVGNPAGLSVDDGEAYRAEDLFATALFCLINQTTEFLSGPAEFYATHPGEWSPALVQSSREALDYLGLRSVVLVSEADLPAIDTAQPGRSFAYDAARAALAAVLATPAGATPPDPANSENATVKTDVIPAVAAAMALPQAYSQAMPAAAPLPTEVLSDTARVDTVPPAAVVAPAATANQRRTPCSSRWPRSSDWHWAVSESLSCCTGRARPNRRRCATRNPTSRHPPRRPRRCRSRCRPPSRRSSSPAPPNPNRRPPRRNHRLPNRRRPRPNRRRRRRVPPVGRPPVGRRHARGFRRRPGGCRRTPIGRHPRSPWKSRRSDDLVTPDNGLCPKVVR